MKRKLAIILAALLALSLPCSVGAETSETTFTYPDTNEGTTELTVVVEPSYTASIPAAATLKAGETEAQDFGTVTVKDVKYINTLLCTVSGTDLENGESKLAVQYQYKIGDVSSDFGTFSIFENKKAVSASLLATVPQTEWNKAIAGTYTATVTFKFEIDNDPTDKSLLLDATEFNSVLKDLVSKGVSSVQNIMFCGSELYDSFYPSMSKLPSKKVGKAKNSKIFAFYDDSKNFVYILSPVDFTINEEFTKEVAFEGFDANALKDESLKELFS